MRTLLPLLLAGSGALFTHPPAHAQTAAGGLQASQLGIVVNDDEPNSVELGEYYRQARNIPLKNVAHVRIPNRPHKLEPEQFERLKEHINAQLGPQIQAVVMVWTAPYAVDCNSITAAYTLGYDAGACSKGCTPGKASAYFNATSTRPFSELGMRLSMLLPTTTLEGGKELIGRGLLSGFRTPQASANYLVTSDTARNSRAQFFPKSTVLPQRKLTVKTVQADTLEGVKDVMVYQTGAAQVGKLDTLQFVPGALADHLTSFGGDLLGEGQMSSLRWLEAGATASYGSVSEPCNYWQKFPHPTVLLRHYLSGNTAIEAYWKSVAWPAQGVFIGEPLAAPYRR